MTTESVAVFMPFRVQEVFDKGGVYCGINSISRNMIFCDKRKLLDLNGFRLGVPGSGKSMGAKAELEFIVIPADDDTLVCSPEGEYGPVIEALGGEVIYISAGSPDHINAMDMVENRFRGQRKGTKSRIGCQKRQADPTASSLRGTSNITYWQYGGISEKTSKSR